MERRPVRVSEAQWNLLLDFLERNPSLAKARGYNNSSRGREESARLWQEVAGQLNSEGSGTTKTAKEWAVYVSNYKSKIKKIVADINADANATGGGPPRINLLSDTDNRFLAIMGPGFGQTTPQVSVNPFPDELSTRLLTQEVVNSGGQEIIQEREMHLAPTPSTSSQSTIPLVVHLHQEADDTLPADAVELEPVEESISMPRQRRRTNRYRSRPLAPLDEARRILSVVETQRAAADQDMARALHLIWAGLQIQRKDICHKLHNEVNALDGVVRGELSVGVGSTQMSHGQLLRDLHRYLKCLNRHRTPEILLNSIKYI